MRKFYSLVVVFGLSAGAALPVLQSLAADTDMKQRIAELRGAQKRAEESSPAATDDSSSVGNWEWVDSTLAVADQAAQQADQIDLAKIGSKIAELKKAAQESPYDKEKRKALQALYIALGTYAEEQANLSDAIPSLRTMKAHLEASEARAASGAVESMKKKTSIYRQKALVSNTTYHVQRSVKALTDSIETLSGLESKKE